MSSFPQPASLIKRMPRERLSALLLELPQGAEATSPFAIIDVRGDDHIGGHIRSSLNYPSHTLDYTMPELVRVLAQKQMIIFHCALSQERGPKAARRYLEEKQRTSDQSGTSAQEVYILDRGFVGWQEK